MAADPTRAAADEARTTTCVADGSGRLLTGEAAARPWTRPALLAAQLPGLCAVCRRWTRGRLCQPCVARFAPPGLRCHGCALRTHVDAPRCGACVTRSDRSLSRTVAALDYAFPWDGLVTGFKFHGRLDVTSTLVRLLDDAISRADDREAPPDLVLPVPLSTQRLRERGYNQAWEIGRRIARRRGLHANPRVLLRIRDTAHQLGLGEAERIENLHHAFLVEPALAHRIRGQRIALVDDVMTSGATAREAARVLRDAGAADVRLWIVARTPAPGER